MKDWAVALCRNDAVAFRSLFDGTKSTARTLPWAHLGKELLTGTMPGRDAKGAPSQEQSANYAQLCLTPDQLAHG